MTYNYKAYLFRKVFAICTLITTAIFSTHCQKDDDFKDTEQNIDFTPVKSFNTISLHTFKKNEKALKAFSSLTKRFKKKNNINRFSTDSIANLILNTESIKYLENTSTNYHSYTFAVSNTPIGSGLQNVMLSLQPDGSYKEFLLHYDITEAEIITLQHGGDVDYGNRLHIEALEDGTFSDFLNRTYYEDGCWYSENYYPERCCSGQHYYGEGETCNEEGECKPQASGGTTTTTVLSCTSGGNGGGNNDGTNDNNNTNNNNPDDPNVGSTGNGDESSVNTCRRNCIEPNDEEEDSLANQCRKIEKLFEDYPTYRDDLVTLASKVNDTIEHAIFKKENSAQTQTLNAGTNGSIAIPPCPSEKYVTVAHTHNSPANKTYSVFSDGDLVAIARNLHCSKIETSRFVAFLSTANGTHYALTIHSATKFKNFIDYVKGYDAPNDNSTNFNSENMLELEVLFNDYYNDPLNPKIKEETTANNGDKINFLKLIKENDVGVTLFETDSEFENFTKI